MMQQVFGTNQRRSTLFKVTVCRLGGRHDVVFNLAVKDVVSVTDGVLTIRNSAGTWYHCFVLANIESYSVESEA